MKTRSLFLICTVFYSFFASCVKDEVIRLDSPGQVLVLNACLSPGQEVCARLSKTIGQGDRIKDFELPTPGTISVYINDEFKGVMRYVVTEDSVKGTEKKYILPDISLLAGDIVRFEANATGYKQVTARTVIPEAPLLLSLDTVRFLVDNINEERIRIYLKMKDNSEERRFYRILIDRAINDEEENYYDNYYNYSDGYYNYYGYYSFEIYYEDPVFTSDLPLQHVGTEARSGYGIFTNNLFRGKEYMLKFSLRNSNYNPGENDPEKRTSYSVRLLSLSDSYYNYYKQNGNLSLAIGSIPLLPSREYVTSYSNVENGFGLVYAYNEAVREIEMR